MSDEKRWELERIEKQFIKGSKKLGKWKNHFCGGDKDRKPFCGECLKQLIRTQRDAEWLKVVDVIIKTVKESKLTMKEKELIKGQFKVLKSAMEAK